MTKYAVFTTPGELDLSALTTFGINSKPNTNNPIGHFGTGLKYAIAVLLRHQIPITIYTGGQEYHFYTKEKDFRGKEFQTCRYKAKGIWKGWKYVELPFTTELGKHWELWQAFRELMSNTLDESGGMFVTTNTEDLENNYRPPRTLIVVEGQAFADIATNEKDDIFLPKDKLKLVAANNDLEVYEGSSRYLYYRGLRAYDLKEWEKSSLYTYNYIGRQAELTEDRTIKHVFYVKWAIAGLVAQSDDRKFIGSLLKVGDRWFEQNLEYNNVYNKSPTFASVTTRIASSPIAHRMPATARTYYHDELRDAPKDPKALEVSDEVWTAITEILQKLTLDKDDDGYLAALNDIEAELAEVFGRSLYGEVHTEIEDLPKMLPPGTYTAKIDRVIQDDDTVIIKAKFDDDIPF
jgi:hypothetical protein